MASRPQLNQSEVGRLDGKVVVLGRWLYDYLLGLGHNPIQEFATPIPGPSPWQYTNESGFDQDVAVSGGTVAFVRDGVAVTISSGVPMVVRLSPGDAARVTYTVAPAVTIIPR